MATLGKLTIVIGAGIVGSILTKEGGSSTVTDFASGALKFVTKRLQQDKDNSRPSSKPQSDSIISQLNNLREELQLLTSSRSVTIVTGNTSGSGTYRVTAVIVVGFVGYGYIWWKGWKLSDLMFVTRRGLSDACAAVGKQLETVSSSIRDVKRHLSSRIDRVDSNLDECNELTASTREEVSILHGELSGFQEDFKSVHDTVQTLETKLDRIEGLQDIATQGVYRLCQFVRSLEQSRNPEHLQASSSSSPRVIDLPQTMTLTRTGSLPPRAPESPSRSASVGTPRILRPSTVVSASGLKELQEISSVLQAGISRSSSISSGTSEVSSGTPHAKEASTSSSSSAQTDSLPPLVLEPPSPSSSAGTPMIMRPSTSVSASGLKVSNAKVQFNTGLNSHQMQELQENSSVLQAGISRSSSINSGASDVSSGAPNAEEASTSSSSSSRSGWRVPGISILTRSRSIVGR